MTSNVGSKGSYIVPGLFPPMEDYRIQEVGRGMLNGYPGALNAYASTEWPYALWQRAAIAPALDAIDRKLADCRARRLTAIMKARRAVSEPE